MLCEDFEDRLSDYLEGSLDSETHSLVASHALRCPVCHETLSLVKSSVAACQTAWVPAPTEQLEARILNSTMPETAMSCAEFEESLTDYLDGFLPASLFHRWERHAALCQQCTELPGQVVRAIGTCYTYKSDELPLPLGLNERILQATLGTASTREMRAPLTARLASWLRLLLDPIVSPQLASVAMMLLIAIFVLTKTVSADGSISGMYRASIRLAEQSYINSKDVSGSGISRGVKEFFVGDESAEPATLGLKDGKDAAKDSKSETDAGQQKQPAPRVKGQSNN